MKNKTYKLTDAMIRKLNPLDKAKEYPGNYPGLALRVNEKGTKTWFYQYRVKGIKYPLRKRIGVYPTIGLKEAELRSKKIDQKKFEGIDPREQDKINVGNLLLKDALDKFYQEDLVVPYYSQSTIQGFKAIMKVWILRITNDADIVQRFTTLKDLQHIKLCKISNKMVEELHKGISKRSPYVANRCVQYLRLFWNSFVKLPNNPFVIETKNITRKRIFRLVKPVRVKELCFVLLERTGTMEDY